MVIITIILSDEECYCKKRLHLQGSEGRGKHTLTFIHRAGGTVSLVDFDDSVFNGFEALYSVQKPPGGFRASVRKMCDFFSPIKWDILCLIIQYAVACYTILFCSLAPCT